MFPAGRRLLLVALAVLPGAAAAQIGVPTVPIRVSVHSGRGFMQLTENGQTFVVRADSQSMAAWADSAAALTARKSEARFAYFDSTLGATEAMTFVRVSADPASPYEIIGEDGRYKGSIRISFDSARAMPRPGHAAPRYPKAAYQQHVSGNVLAQVVVDTTGHTDMSKFRILYKDSQLFSDAVREALATERFFPAERDGRLVSEIVQQPFAFRAP